MTQMRRTLTSEHLPEAVAHIGLRLRHTPMAHHAEPKLVFLTKMDGRQWDAVAKR